VAGLIRARQITRVDLVEEVLRQVERPNPSINLAIVRRGLDYGRQGFDRWDLTREVLKAFRPVSSAGLQ
jgi:hypothetical protein